MKALIAAADAIDALQAKSARTVHWLVLVAVLAAAGNALGRYASTVSPNAWLEIQWHLFSAVFLFCTRDVRSQELSNLIAGRLSRSAQAWMRILAAALFLLPAAVLTPWLSWSAYVDQGMSAAGGFVVWPARLLVPLGYGLLVLHCVCGLIKDIGFLTGPDRRLVSP